MLVCFVGTEWVDPEDPTVIAENELLGAAAAIEAAAKKLEQLRPRTKPKVRRAFYRAAEFSLSLLTSPQGHIQSVCCTSSVPSAPHTMNDGCPTDITLLTL